MKVDIVSQKDIEKVSKQLELIDKKIDSNIEKRWLTTDDVAKYTGYKLETIRSKIKNRDFIKEIHYFKKGRKILFDKFEIDKWIMGLSTKIKVENFGVNLSNEQFGIEYDKYLDSLLAN